MGQWYEIKERFSSKVVVLPPYQWSITIVQFYRLTLVFWRENPYSFSELWFNSWWSILNLVTILFRVNLYIREDFGTFI